MESLGITDEVILASIGIYDYNYETREQAKQSIFEYIETYYNKKRRHSTIGYCTPEEFEKMAYNVCIG